VFCPDCGTRNPGENRFCGMCGERLPDRTERTSTNKSAPAIGAPPAGRVPVSRAEDVLAEKMHADKWVEVPLRPAEPGMSSLNSDSADAEHPARALVDSLAARPARDFDSRRRPVAPALTSSPSFLGLGSAETRSDRVAVPYDDYGPPQREISWRFWALLLVLLGVVALFGLQWRAHRLNANQGVAQPAPQSSPSDDVQQPASNNPAASTPAAATADKPEGDNPQDKGKGAQTTEQQQDKPDPAEAQPPKSAAGNDGTATEERDAAPKEVAALTESPRDFSDAPVTQADSLIAAGDCNGAVRVLHGAGQNPRAMTKLGAMYLTGTCVASDRVTAYAWFSQAFNADPHNLRLESTRRTIWSQMTDTERAKVEAGVRPR